MTLQEKPDRYVALLIMAALTLVYACCTDDFPLLEDDGLFIMAAYDAGTAHAPGYPLFVLISQFFLLLPAGSVAFKVHLTNCVLAALSCSLFYILLRRHLGISLPVAITAVMVLATSNLFWQQAIVAEAYMLNVMLMLAVLLLSLEARQKAEAKPWVLAAGLVYGAALANHWPLTLLVTPAIAVISLRLIRPENILPGIAGVSVGLLPYLWMYLTADDARFSHVGAFPSLEAFLGFLAREVYLDVDNNPLVGVADKKLFVIAYLSDFTRQFSLLVLPLIAIGIVLQWQRLQATIAAGLSLFLLLPFLLVLLIDFEYERPELAAMLAYPLPLYVMSVVWFAIGLEAMLTRARGTNLHGMVMLFLPVLFVTTNLYRNYAVVAENQAGWSEPLARQMLASLPENAVVFTMGSWSMAQLAYLHHVDGERPDIRLLSQYGTFLPDRLFGYFLSEGEKSEALRQFLDESDRPVYFLNPGAVKMCQSGLLYHDCGQASLSQPGGFQIAEYLLTTPVGQWNQLYWRELVEAHIATLASKPIESEQHPLLGLYLAGHQSRAPEIDVAYLARLIEGLDRNIDALDRIDRAMVLKLKGSLMELLEERRLAREFYHLSLTELPRVGNRAYEALLSMAAASCSQKDLDQLLADWPFADAVGAQQHFDEVCQPTAQQQK